MDKKHLTICLLIFILALSLRLMPVMATRDFGIALDDMFQYDMLARSLLAGHGFRWYAQDDLNLILPHVKMDVPPNYDPRGMLTSFRAPLYPLFLAGVYAANGLTGRFLAARLVQAILGALMAPGTFLLARRLGRSQRASHLAALIVAVYPMLVLYPFGLVTENLFWPLTLFSALATLSAKRARGFALAGVLLGAVMLTRSIAAGFALIAALWVWRRGGWRHAAILLIGFGLMVVPWSVRNTLLHGRLTFVESSMGYNLYLGYHPQGTGTFQFGPSLDLLTIMDDAERDAHGRQLTWEFIRADPPRVLYLTARKLGYFWGLEKRAVMYFYSNNAIGHLSNEMLATTLIVLCAPLMLLLPAAIAGASNRPWDSARWLVMLWAAYYVGAHILIMAEDRFHLALVPFMAALAGPLHSSTWKRRLIVLALIALALANWGWELARDWPKLAQLFSATGHLAGFTY